MDRTIEFKVLDSVLHSQLRLAIVSTLMSVEEADFNFLKEKTGATSGNISVQLGRLKEAGYVEITKTFRNNYPLTKCRMSAKGILAFDNYVDALKSYVYPERNF